MSAAMVHRQLAKLGPEFSVRVGDESIAIRGTMELGWTVSHSDGAPAVAYRYATIDELAFVLINLSLALGSDVAAA
ncbi:MAG: hypothetical protein SF182_06175 [Deltaproteobacteria bacterium]|nr:hypothetical protein [Deltaproteobacteria bacterium]